MSETCQHLWTRLEKVEYDAENDCICSTWICLDCPHVEVKCVSASKEEEDND